MPDGAAVTNLACLRAVTFPERSTPTVVSFGAFLTKRPLYLFSNEQLMLTSSGGAVAVGNGNGIKAFGGTFSLVVNP
jgi:hypothetical protein